MANESDSILTYSELSRGQLITLVDYQCCAPRGLPAHEEQSESNEIVLMRRGIFCRHFGSKTVTADVNHVAFFPRGYSYRVSHPADCGDRGTVISVSSETLRSMISEFAQTTDNKADVMFPFLSAPCTPEVFRLHRWLVLALERGLIPVGSEQLLIEETALQLVSMLIESTFAK